MTFTPENVLLIGSIMLFISIMVSKAGNRFGIPSLLLFLGVGMAMGSDGLGIHFDSAETAQFIGVMALSIILFSGGMDTKFKEIKPIAVQGVVLATLGVVLTCAFTGGFIYLIAGLLGFPLGLPESLLLAAVMSSTDSATVFSLLRSKGLYLRENLRPALELESGSNDPMAFMLTIVLIQYIQEGSMSWAVLITFAVQIVVGTLSGVFFGKASVWMVNRLNLTSQALYSIFLVTCVFFIFSFTDLLGGNGYLAVYLAGLMVGNAKMVHRKSIGHFFDSFTWLWQIVMFLTLGLLVNPSELLPVALFASIIAVFMIILGRPLSVIICLLPFKNFSRSARVYISWVGLRGAVPIIFATYPLIAHIEDASLIFNVVFFITIISLVVQGMTVTSMAKYLGVGGNDDSKPLEFGVELPDEIKSVLSEMVVTEDFLKNGNTLMQLSLPDNTLVMMIKRENGFFVPKGKTELQIGDKLLVISDDDQELRNVYEKLGVKYYTMEKNT